MRLFRRLLLIVGTIAAVVGMFWVGQGTGVIRWPASSFMVDDYVWVVNGAVVAVAGLVMVLVARRLPRR